MEEYKMEKPKHRRSPNASLSKNRPLDWIETRLQVPKKQSWYKPVNPGMRGVG